MAQTLSKNQHYTFGDYSLWGDDERYELIDGVPYLMAPAPNLGHQTIVSALVQEIANALENSPCRLLVAPVDVRLPKQDELDEAIDTVVQPDILVVCDQSKLDAKGVRGAPDWIIEVISPSTAVRDQIDKKKLYERHGVREYWLVHPTDRVATIYRLNAGVYDPAFVIALQGETASHAVPGVYVRWDRVLRWLENIP